MGARSCSRCLIYLCVFILIHVLVYFLHFFWGGGGAGTGGERGDSWGEKRFKGVNPQQAQAKGKIFKLCSFFKGEKKSVFSPTAVTFVLRFEKRHSADSGDLICIYYVSCRMI